MGQETNKTAKELILALQEAGVTNEYVNVILKQVQKEKIDMLYEGIGCGVAKARGKMMKTFKVRENYNGQFLTNWAKTIKV